jgi:hypothetical protein
MTSTPDLNISGSPIYENLVATSGDPYQPPAYQLPAVFEPPPEAQDPGYASGSWYSGGNATPDMLSQFLGRIFDGQNWMAVVVFGGPMADQLRQAQQFPQYQMPQPPQPFMPTPQYGYAGAPGFNAGSAEQAAMAQAYQAYQQMMMYQWAAQQQALLQQTGLQQTGQQQPLPPQMTAGQQPLALTAGPGPQMADVPMPAIAPSMPEAAAPVMQPGVAGFEGMLTRDWASWLGQTSQSARPEPVLQDSYEDDQEVSFEPSYERRGGLTSRLGAAMRELRGR